MTGNGYVTASVNQEEAKRAGTDLQFQAISMFVPNVDNTPNPPTTPPNPVNPDGTPTTPTPPTGPVNVPNLPVGPDPTLDTPPVTPVTPGYTDGTTPIVPNVVGDIQKAYPKADTDNLPDTVTFTNALTNNGGQPDSLQLFPTGAVKSDGTLNTGWTFNATTATFTQNAGLPTEIKVQFLNPDGTAVTVKTGAVYPTLSVPANSTAFYQTKVTYPDLDDSTPFPRSRSPSTWIPPRTRSSILRRAAPPPTKSTRLRRSSVITLPHWAPFPPRLQLRKSPPTAALQAA